MTIGELADTIIAILGGDKEIVCEDQRYRPWASEVMELLCDAGKARELLGWEPRVSLKQGLALTVAFIRDHLDRYNSRIYNV